MTSRCLLLALSGLNGGAEHVRFRRVKRTSRMPNRRSAIDPKRTFIRDQVNRLLAERVTAYNG